MMMMIIMIVIDDDDYDDEGIQASDRERGSEEALPE